ncbi:Hypothetical protein CINCED_3A024678 [Cinara cedri]|uniref:Centriolar and ciliogenesis-associated protein HYLS1 C-terminal domain-containing protein n=1 Tax=Cinara cedri TaxID=506608 RepID=A0A5E4MC82_9HEMI|nr:Hypothetical protein CINCED_3A024678 [Cinara cedri]
MYFIKTPDSIYHSNFVILMEIDPVEVLHHLNALGYENVEPHLLQKFIKDLKKLIKYEKQKSKGNVKIDSMSNDKSPLKETIILTNNHCTNKCCIKKINNVYERLSRPISKTKLCSKAVSTVGVQTDNHDKQKNDNKYSQILKKKQMDPVSLHQYYQTEWEHHKIPGEKNHDKLRWQIRQKMIHK